jgi:membrane protease subunit (stomatin/prohibitin family)
MALIQAFAGALGGTFADQWKDIITCGLFDEHTVVMPGIIQQNNNGRGSNSHGSNGIVSNGSKIYIPENTAAFIFDQGGIETVITQPGGYEYQNGQSSVFNGDGIGKSIFDAIGERFTFGGQPPANKQIAFVNLREIRGVRFGTPGPLVYHDLFYGADLEIRARGTLSLKIVDPVKFVCNFLPANVSHYTFDDPRAHAQILSEFIQSFMSALNSLSDEFRISQLPGKSAEIAKRLMADKANAGTWRARFGFEVAGIGVENIEFTPESRELVKQFSLNKMTVKAYEDVSQRAGNIAAQQKIAQGIEDNGLGDMGGMVFGMNMAQGLGPNAEMPGMSRAGGAGGGGAAPVGDGASSSAQAHSALSLDEEIQAVKKLKELLDNGILSQSEFDQKKKEIMGL